MTARRALKKILELLYVWAVLLGGFALLCLALGICAEVLAFYLAYLIALHVEGPVALAISQDVLVLMALIFIVRSSKVRDAVRAVWTQLLKNL